MSEHLPHLDEAWAFSAGGPRLDAVKRAAPKLRDKILSTGHVSCVRTFDVGTFPYPLKYAFFGACKLPFPYVWMTNRALFFEYKDTHGATRRLLANPTDPEGSRLAPYFVDLQKMLPKSLEWTVTRQQKPLPDQLREAGIDPASIDFITFDHLHVQKISLMLGPNGHYPKAKLLVTPAELEIVRSLHPLQKYWYVAGSLAGVPDEDLIVFDRDVLLGGGLALIRTPGHTDGNHSIVFSVPGGLMTVSENGVAADCYAPLKSAIPGLRSFSEKTGAEVILNANTLERTLDQYTSMCLEACLARPLDAAEWPRHFSSSELDTHLLAPGIRATHLVRKVEHGAFGAGSEPRSRAA